MQAEGERTMEEIVSVGARLQSALAAQCSDDVLERLKRIGIGTLVQNLQRLGFHQTYLAGVLPQNQHRSFSGRAMTMRCLPPREDVVKELASWPDSSLHRRSFETIDRGQVLVIDARGDQSGAVLGDVLASRMAFRGAAALVTDGCIRDLPAMQKVNMPLYARGDHPRTFGEVHVPFDLNVPVQCAGVLVMPGDIIVGDEEGVVVVPSGIAERLVGAGEEQELLDAFVLTKIAEGATLKEAFPPNERIRAEYDAWRGKQKP
jgi:5-oxopent-3-ene-1,2,5-tricarboxylate decarboxylase/2-hydroxyhepta-2,4-diene-1,7-dioate isomerase